MKIRTTGSVVALAAFALMTTAALAQQPVIGLAAELSRLVLHDPSSPTVGNPHGNVTIVAFLDYNCPFCRRSTPQLDAFLKTDPDVRVVFKDWSILAPSSMTEAKVALAAAYQGKYQAAQDALMAIKNQGRQSRGRPAPQGLALVARLQCARRSRHTRGDDRQIIVSRQERCAAFEAKG